MASLKRRFPSDDIGGDDDIPDASFSTSSSTRARPPHTKRRRCTTLERGFAGLRLNSNDQGDASVPLSIEEVPLPSHNSPPIMLGNNCIPSSSATIRSRPSTPMETDFVDGSPLLLPSTIVRAAHVEEPTPSDGTSVTDVKMHVSSWYEPEKDRIIITDLDGSSSDEEDTPPVNIDVNISSAVLDRLKGVGHIALKPPVPRPISHPADNMELILFKPIGRLGVDIGDEEFPSTGDDRNPSTSSVVDEAYEDSDAMDIEL
ncbi:hypothetical protein DENSPDRAFT_931260 [Dentipellis sp. KUC8613]|nr:hypothetical protein DENSPDRAFT_931260 [Dentipellis sp. KUC8613]